ncbi:MAG: hypothetical protein S4CHLAM102_11130 [Chlamydiia bacterium]|nr:hypothetical protein [Chlamydiia bacterium]
MPGFCRLPLDVSSIQIIGRVCKTQAKTPAPPWRCLLALLHPAKARHKPIQNPGPRDKPVHPSYLQLPQPPIPMPQPSQLDEQAALGSRHCLHERFAIFASAKRLALVPGACILDAVGRGACPWSNAPKGSAREAPEFFLKRRNLAR